MANVWQTMNKMRSHIRKVTDCIGFGSPTCEEEKRLFGSKINVDEQLVDERFYTWDHDTGQIVTNFKTQGWHFIFDLDGNLIKKHTD